MEITEAGLYAAFGIEPPADEGAKGQDVADPEVADEGVQVQDVADPDNDDTQGGDPETEAGSAVENEEAGKPTGKPPLTPEQRRENAARRREAEKQAAIDQAVAAERAIGNQRMEQLLRDLNLQDPETAEPITTMEQFEAFRRQQNAAAFNRKVGDGSLAREDIVQIVQQETQAAAQRQAQQAAQQAAQQRLQQELQNIQKMDASIKDYADLLTMPGAEAFKEKVARGYTLEDAFVLVRGPELQQAQAQAARDSARRSAAGKEHLNGTGNGRGAGSVSVPSDVLKLYRLLNPNVSDADILNHFNQNRK